MTTFIVILILAVLIFGVYSFVKKDGKNENVKPIYNGNTGIGSPTGSGSTSGSAGSAKPLGKIESPEVAKEEIKTKSVETVKSEKKAKTQDKKKGPKKPGAKRGRKPKNKDNGQDQLLLS